MGVQTFPAAVASGAAEVNAPVVAIAYNTDGSIATVTESDAGGAALRTTTFAYNVDGSVATTVRVAGGVTETSTFAYTNGVVSGVTRVRA